MRLLIVASVLSILALGTLVASPGSATAAKSTMGCDTDTEVWDSALGKCQPGTPKYKRRSAEPAAQPAPKMSATAKKAPAVKKAAAKKAAPAPK